MVPAYNAEPTLATALESLVDQTFADWEAIVVDDGSTDGTVRLVEERAAREPRLRLVRQPNAGVSAARNAGLAVARGEWIAFLDADDWLAPEAFATLIDALAARPLDAVHSGWTRIAADGRSVDEICPRSEEDMFSWHAHNCAFAIHSVLVRRELVERAGGFDPGLTTCEDWDLWLRLSRLGARWGRVDAQLAYYRMRAASASLVAPQLLRDGLVVIDRAHGPDARLAGQALKHPVGEKRALRARARLVHAVYSIALALGQGHDALAMLDEVAGDRCPDLGADQVAYAIFEGVPLGAGTIPSDWPSFSTDLVERVGRLLDELERLTGAAQLAVQVRRLLGRLTVEAGAVRALFGRIASAAVDLESPLADIAVDPTVERLLLEPRYAGTALARVELPVCDGRIPAELIADAVADAHAWTLLGAFFEASITAELEVSTDGARLLVRRAGHVLVDRPLPRDEPAAGLVHNYAGWELFLQELCGDPATPNAAFYDAAHDAELVPCGLHEARGGWAAIELSAPLPELVSSEPVRVAASVGGATLAAVELEPVHGRVLAGTLRRVICTHAGFELCRLAAREGLIGRPAGDGVNLRARLAEAAARAAHDGRRDDAVRLRVGLDVRAPGERSPTGNGRAPARLSLAPGWEAEAIRALNGYRAARLIARRRGARTGLSGSRAAVIPRSAGADAVAAARTAGDLVIEVGAPGPDAPALYVPGIVWDAESASRPATGESHGRAGHVTTDTGRAYFEALFAAGADPWDYTSPYEQGKYEQTLSLLAGPAPARALELACAEGHFTRQLAPRVGRLLACDVSEIALQRARRRCEGLANVRFTYHDLFSDPLDGRYDLIVCSEVLYYAGDRHRLDHAAGEIARALEPGGRLLSAHANLLVDDRDRPGFDWELPFGARVIGEAFSAAGLELAEELANPIYRVRSYRRPRRPALRRLRRARPRRAEARLPDRLPPEVEERFRWEGGEPAGATRDGPITRELPILMYHRVAPTGSERLREWRLTPDQFEAQLHYLRTAGYRTASLDEWQRATERHLPLPGRRVMLTFDDGYEDFAEFAYPLLRQYELDATVFLVSDRVGLTNEWDRGYGEVVALMDWDTIRTLDSQGVSFGGHSASHPMLTALGLDEVVRQASRCRAELVEQLGHVARAFAYPYGDFDAAVARMVGGCGFEFGLTVEGYAASASVPMLTLPRMNVAGTDSFEAFVRMLAPSSPPT